jgi:uncharacterized membrane protein HdeD (DUF308 family)
MDPQPALPLAPLIRVGIEELRRRWGWFLALGVLLIALGAFALGHSLMATLSTMLVLGTLLMFAGVSQIVQSFGVREWGGFFLGLLSGILYAVCGLFIWRHPVESAVELTLLVALFLVFTGIFRICIAVAVRFPNWPWILLHGIVSTLLGISIWNGWPSSGLQVIGIFLGIDMIFHGWSLVMLGLTARRLPPLGSRTE